MFPIFATASALLLPCHCLCPCLCPLPCLAPDSGSPLALPHPCLCLATTSVPVHASSPAPVCDPAYASACTPGFTPACATVYTPASGFAPAFAVPVHFFRLRTWASSSASQYFEILILDSSGIRASFDPKCNQQIIHSKVNFKIPPPPTSERKTLHYHRANAELIQRSLKIFHNMSNFIPNGFKRFVHRHPSTLDRQTFENHA